MIFCNIRGIGNSCSRSCLKNLVVTHKAVLVAILEPMLAFNKASILGRFTKLDCFAGNHAEESKIWVFWHGSFS